MWPHNTKHTTSNKPQYSACIKLAGFQNAQLSSGTFQKKQVPPKQQGHPTSTGEWTNVVHLHNRTASSLKKGGNTDTCHMVNKPRGQSANRNLPVMTDIDAVIPKHTRDIPRVANS